MKYRIVPAEPTQEQIERVFDDFWWHMEPEERHQAARAVYLAMINQCPEVSGEPVAFVDECDLLDMVKGLEPTISRDPVSEHDVALYTTPQPDHRDAEIARLKEAVKVAVEALAESVDLVRYDYEEDWRHGMPTRAAQLAAKKSALDAHQAAITTLKGVIE
jgi:hypothetical protein